MKIKWNSVANATGVEVEKLEMNRQNFWGKKPKYSSGKKSKFWTEKKIYLKYFESLQKIFFFDFLGTKIARLPIFFSQFRQFKVAFHPKKIEVKATLKWKRRRKSSCKMELCQNCEWYENAYIFFNEFVRNSLLSTVQNTKFFITIKKFS